MYDAFISYSHAADGKLAPALRFALHRFAKPWYKLRALSIFHDTTNLSISPGLCPSIEKALGDSKYFILLASREAAASKWVQKEVEFWLMHRQSNKLLIILTEGEIAWDDDKGDFDRTKTDALPRNLANAFTDEPLYLDFRWIRADKTQDLSLNNAKFRDDIADLAATLHARSKDEIVGEDVAQHRKTKRIVWGGIITLILLTVLSLIAATIAGKEWIEAKEHLATNYWSQAVSAKKGNERLKAAHFFAKAGKEFGSMLTYASFANNFGIREHKVSEVLSQIKGSMLNAQCSVGPSRGRLEPCAWPRGAHGRDVGFSQREQDCNLG